MLKRPLASTPNIQVMSFHQLCDSRIAQVKRDLGRNLLNEADTAFPGADLFDVHMPFALALSNEVLPHKFDAIVIDEAQDFSDEYWFAIEELLNDPKDGAIYIFIDPNQALYKRHANLPVREDPYYLTVNCRNTTYIHKAAYRYYRGEPTDPPEIEGADLITLAGPTTDEQASQIAREVSRLLGKEGVAAQQIVVLVLGRPKHHFYGALTRCSLGAKARWSIEVHDSSTVVIDTVKRFKGLEASIVFLWLPALLSDLDDREGLYVGLSRAKSIIYLVGPESACAAVTAAMPELAASS
jgi:superfamily I DNA and RNA helicase